MQGVESYDRSHSDRHRGASRRAFVLSSRSAQAGDEYTTAPLWSALRKINLGKLEGWFGFSWLTVCLGPAFEIPGLYFDS